MTPPEATIAVALSELRGELRTALADIQGSLRLLVERSERTDADLRQLREDVDGEIAALRREVEDLKRARWPQAAIGTLTGVAGVAVAGIALFLR